MESSKDDEITLVVKQPVDKKCIATTKVKPVIKRSNIKLKEASPDDSKSLVENINTAEVVSTSTSILSMSADVIGDSASESSEKHQEAGTLQENMSNVDPSEVNEWKEINLDDFTILSEATEHMSDDETIGGVIDVKAKQKIRKKIQWDGPSVINKSNGVSEIYGSKLPNDAQFSKVVIIGDSYLKDLYSTWPTESVFRPYFIWKKLITCTEIEGIIKYHQFLQDCSNMLIVVCLGISDIIEFIRYKKCLQPHPKINLPIGVKGAGFIKRLRSLSNIMKTSHPSSHFAFANLPTLNFELNVADILTKYHRKWKKCSCRYIVSHHTQGGYDADLNRINQHISNKELSNVKGFYHFRFTGFEVLYEDSAWKLPGYLSVSLAIQLHNRLLATLSISGQFIESNIKLFSKPKSLKCVPIYILGDLWIQTLSDNWEYRYSNLRPLFYPRERYNFTTLKDFVSSAVLPDEACLIISSIGSEYFIKYDEHVCEKHKNVKYPTPKNCSVSEFKEDVKKEMRAISLLLESRKRCKLFYMTCYPISNRNYKNRFLKSNNFDKFTDKKCILSTSLTINECYKARIEMNKYASIIDELVIKYNKENGLHTCDVRLLKKKVIDPKFKFPTFPVGTTIAQKAMSKVMILMREYLNSIASLVEKGKFVFDNSKSTINKIQSRKSTFNVYDDIVITIKNKVTGSNTNLSTDDPNKQGDATALKEAAIAVPLDISNNSSEVDYRVVSKNEESLIVDKNDTVNLSELNLQVISECSESEKLSDHPSNFSDVSTDAYASETEEAPLSCPQKFSESVSSDSSINSAIIIAMDAESISSGDNVPDEHVDLIKDTDSISSEEANISKKLSISPDDMESISSSASDPHLHSSFKAKDTESISSEENIIVSTNECLANNAEPISSDENEQNKSNLKDNDPMSNDGIDVCKTNLKDVDMASADNNNIKITATDKKISAESIPIDTEEDNCLNNIIDIDSKNNDDNVTSEVLGVEMEEKDPNQMKVSVSNENMTELEESVQDKCITSEENCVFDENLNKQTSIVEEPSNKEEDTNDITMTSKIADEKIEDVNTSTLATEKDLSLNVGQSPKRKIMKTRVKKRTSLITSIEENKDTPLAKKCNIKLTKKRIKKKQILNKAAATMESSVKKIKVKKPNEGQVDEVDKKVDITKEASDIKENVTKNAENGKGKISNKTSDTKGSETIKQDDGPESKPKKPIDVQEKKIKSGDKQENKAKAVAKKEKTKMITKVNLLQGETSKLKIVGDISLCSNTNSRYRINTTSITKTEPPPVATVAMRQPQPYGYPIKTYQPQIVQRPLEWPANSKFSSNYINWNNENVQRTQFTQVALPLSVSNEDSNYPRVNDYTQENYKDHHQHTSVNYKSPPSSSYTRNHDHVRSRSPYYRSSRNVSRYPRSSRDNRKSSRSWRDDRKSSSRRSPFPNKRSSHRSIEQDALESLREFHDKECNMYRNSLEAHPDYTKERREWFEMMAIHHGYTAESYFLQEKWKSVWLTKIEQIFNESWEEKKRKCLASLPGSKRSRSRSSSRESRPRRHKIRKSGRKSSQRYSPSQTSSYPMSTPGFETVDALERKINDYIKRSSDTIPINQSNFRPPQISDSYSSYPSTSRGHNLYFNQPPPQKIPVKTPNILEVTSVLSEISDRFGNLGPHVRSLHDQLTRDHSMKKDLMSVLMDDDSLLLLKMVSDHISHFLGDSNASIVQKAIYLEAQEKLANLLKFIKNTKKPFNPLQLESLSNLTRGMDMMQTLKLIKENLKLKDRIEPADQEVMDIYIALKASENNETNKSSMPYGITKSFAKILNNTGNVTRNESNQISSLFGMLQSKPQSKMERIKNDFKSMSNVQKLDKFRNFSNLAFEEKSALLSYLDETESSNPHFAQVLRMMINERR